MTINGDTARDRILERPLPNSAESERAVLGAIILDNGLIDEAMFTLKPEDFYVPAHRRVFLAMCDLASVGSAINPILIGEHLRRDGALESVGGITFISNLFLGLPHFGNIAHYAQIIAGKSLLRLLVKVTNRITSEALEEEDEPRTILSHAEQLIFELGAEHRGDAGRRYDVLGRAVRAEVERWRQGHVSSVPTGLPELDEKLKLKGLAKKDLIYIAARSSRGKTALALQIAKNAAMRGTHVLLFSLEMSGESLYMRTHSSVAEVAHWRMRPDVIQEPATLAMIEAAYPRTDALPITVFDDVRAITQIEAISRHYVRRFNVGLIIGDYIQLADAELKNKTRNEEVAHLSRAGKGIAKALDVPFIWTSQLKRGKSDGERPELDDMRESGNQEQDADLVFMPYATDKELDKEVRAMKLYVPKQRNGRAGFEIEVDFDADMQTFLTDRMYADREIDDIEREPPVAPEVEYEHIPVPTINEDTDDFAV